MQIERTCKVVNEIESHQEAVAREVLSARTGSVTAGEATAAGAPNVKSPAPISVPVGRTL